MGSRSEGDTRGRPNTFFPLGSRLVRREQSPALIGWITLVNLQNNVMTSTVWPNICWDKQRSELQWATVIEWRRCGDFLCFLDRQLKTLPRDDAVWTRPLLLRSSSSPTSYFEIVWTSGVPRLKNPGLKPRMFSTKTAESDWQQAHVTASCCLRVFLCLQISLLHSSGLNPAPPLP